MAQDSEEVLSESDFLRRELHAVINRYSNMTVYQVLGCLDVVKMDFWDKLERLREGD